MKERKKNSCTDDIHLTQRKIYIFTIGSGIAQLSLIYVSANLLKNA